MVELLICLAMLTLLAATLFPALAGSKANTKVTACTANFRQFAVAVNLYFQDNKGYLPRPFPDPFGGGMYAWNTSTNLLFALSPYGVAVSHWFCPVRANELDTANTWSLLHLNHALLTIRDLTAYFNSAFSGEVVLNHNWWVPRSQGATSFPIDFSTKPLPLQPTYGRGSDPFVYGWPVRVDDRASARVAFISDKCGSGSGGGFPNGWPLVGSDIADIAPNTAHFFNGVLRGVNAAYVDGHVEARGPAKIRCVYVTPVGNTFWFY